MMDVELHEFARQVAACKTPEQLFGDLGTAPDAQLAAGKKKYRDFSRIAHEDKHQNNPADKIASHAAFTRLSELWMEAQARIGKGIYGKAGSLKPTVIKTARTLYTIESGLAAGDYANLYRGFYVDKNNDRADVLIKMARQPVDNDMLDNEAHTLTALHVATDKLALASIQYPAVLESFTTKPESRRTNVFKWREGYRPLNDIVATYPGGVDPRHFVWIWNRLLMLLSVTHQQGIIHGAVLPSHILVHPETHDLTLVGWTFAEKSKEHVKAISAGHHSWYPPEVLSKRPASAATDIYMAARSMVYILGGHGEAPVSVPAPFRRFLASCLIEMQARRPSDAYALHEEFQEVARSVYGRRRFVRLELATQ
jgi:serine/threonine protein kinase